MRLRYVFCCAAIAAAIVPASLRADAGRLRAAQDVLVEMAGAKDEGIPSDLISQAKCIVIVPGVKKAAFGVGGEYGRGYLSCRLPDSKKWSAPGAVRIEGGSVGFQIGGSDTDLVMIVKNDSGVDRLLSTKFTLGADA